ncbi:MAG: undecaprenyl-phosphate glucose phosphotransferase [Acidobacteria bacterium]|nr:undecaprenyl-phosphate glucose phosphotransferase [Acidobacteriota bacterium]
MVRRYNRLLVALHVGADTCTGILAFLLAYWVRFHSGLIVVTKGYPPFQQYLWVTPLVGALVPLAFHLHGLYRLRRGRSRIDDFFGVLVGSVLAVVLGVVSTLYVQTYYFPDPLKDRGVFEVSQLVWGLFLVLNVVLSLLTRLAVRDWLERRWRAGIGLKRVLVAGAGDLGRLVVDRILEHRELGLKVIGFVDDKAEAGGHLGYRGLPLLGTLGDAAEILQREKIDHLYVALPLEEHVKMLTLVENANREIVDIRVVPDLLQMISLRARLEDLDGLPIINIHDVPLRGLNAVLKRGMDIAMASASLVALAIPMAVLLLIIRVTSPGAALFRQERMGLDGKPFHVWKFRSMYDGAERESGPVWAVEDDPRCTPIGQFLRRSNMDELPQLWNVLCGDMSLVGPRPERPFFVDQFKQRIPQYMLRHKVRAGLTGWAQVNGWRGNTSIEKRIEYDLYYIENWSITLDLKIMWLTVVKGFFHKHAY